MILSLCFLICLMALVAIAVSMWHSKKLSEELKISQDGLTGFQNFLLTLSNQHHSREEELLVQQRDLLNRLLSHNWVEYQQASLVSPSQFSENPERVVPDDAYNEEHEADDLWGEYTPPEKFEDALEAVRGAFNVST